MKYVILFEDDPDKRPQLAKYLKKYLPYKVSVVEIDGHGKQDRGITYEDQLKEMLMKYGTGKALVLCDKDLSGLGEKFIGLSYSTVAAVADRLGLPLCLYARGEEQQGGEAFLRSLAPWEKKRIFLDYRNEKNLAVDSAKIFKGFNDIAIAYSKLSKKSQSTPARALAAILGKEGIDDRISLYGSGEQGFLEDIMPFITRKSPSRSKSIATGELKRRMPRILGNWLYTSILRFPGIFVNQIAAASYLNINPNDFSKPDIQNLFRKAKYSGPFADAEIGPWWWRHELDNIVINRKFKDGFSLAKVKHPRIRPCLDSKDEPAGFYCMVTKEPVSEKNSRGGVSWFPSGADLARIRYDKFRELGPWIGLY